MRINVKILTTKLFRRIRNDIYSFFLEENIKNLTKYHTIIKFFLQKKKNKKKTLFIWIIKILTCYLIKKKNKKDNKKKFY